MPFAKWNGMKDAIERLDAFDHDGSFINAIVETPKGSRVKYSWSPKAGLFRFKRALPEGMMFPFNYGFIPSTRGQDGDPLDIVILNDQPMALGSWARVHLLAVIEAEQTEEGEPVRNDKLIGAAMDEETPPKFVSLPLDQSRINQIVFFFSSYNRISGKEFKTLRTGSRDDAEKLVRAGVRLFKRRRK